MFCCCTIYSISWDISQLNSPCSLPEFRGKRFVCTHSYNSSIGIVTLYSNTASLMQMSLCEQVLYIFETQELSRTFLWFKFIGPVNRLSLFNTKVFYVRVHYSCADIVPSWIWRCEMTWIWRCEIMDMTLWQIAKKKSDTRKLCFGASNQRPLKQKRAALTTMP